MDRTSQTNDVRSYQERYCAFVDILGFRRLIDRLADGTTTFVALRKLLQKIHSPVRYNIFTNSDFQAQSISDAVAISAAVNRHGLEHLCLALTDLACELLFEGFFLRGAIVKGRLYHDDQMVFGEALVKAYSLEQEVVRYPRIMLSSDVVADLNGYLEESPHGNLEGSVQQADDGPYFLHVLSPFVIDARYAVEDISKADDTDQAAEAEVALEPFILLKDKIQQRFTEAVDNPRIFEKVQWFAAYWNSCIGRRHKSLRVIGPGASPKPAVFG